MAYACICRGIKDADVRRALARCGGEPGRLACELQLDDPAACGRCLADFDRFLAGATAARPTPARQGAVA